VPNDREILKHQLEGAADVFDTRTRAEFTGEDARNRTRSGHLPGARHGVEHRQPTYFAV
jgi:3-mercaptopyruvate sulfurtransferase SseA